MREQVTQDLRILKTIVIVLGVLLAAGLGVLIWGLLRQTGPAPLEGSFPLALPQGAKITDMTLSGRLLALHVEGPQGQQILLLDTQSGRVIKTLPVIEGSWASKTLPQN